jgi:hypothetical protein
VTYNKGLGRYILAAQQVSRYRSNDGHLGIYEAPEPWGPWRTILLKSAWDLGLINKAHSKTVFFNFSNKWASPDGRDFVMLYSDVDEWASIEGKFTDAGPIEPPPSAPSPPVGLVVKAPELDDYPSWIDDLIARFKGEPVANPPITIKEYRYKEKTVYFVPQRCCDIFSDLYDENGTLIAHPDGGITGQGDGRAPDFFKNAVFVREIWADPRGKDDIKRVLAPAPIESVDIAVLESFPPQYRARVVSGLPNGCARFDHWTVDLDAAARVFTIKVLNSIPADGTGIACTEIYRTVEHSIPLEGVEPGAEYTVRVNNVSVTFTAH